ncbi:hypothetical protein QFC20_005900 [Naganishia adeliensis]|uniref:Uncharacterized protein n=1 Tax=Naganishia adeliensis TaxID=92952 RepID=A0ACC2VGR0_9TREE|nr:hypothetical protein QFC20_005900 [Naganishia adeliensis]
MILFRPYATMRLEKNDTKMENPRLMITYACSIPIPSTQPSTFLSTSHTTKTPAAQHSTKSIFELLTLLAPTMKSYMNASRKVPVKLLGSFLATNEPEFFIASVKVNAKRKEVTTRFALGFEEMVHQVERLEDVRDSA